MAGGLDMQVIEIIKALLFGLVEGITEWLPVSSTGHMIILNELFPLNASEEFYSLFEVVIQLGAIMAVVIVFWKKIWPFGQRNNRWPAAQSGPLSWVKLDIVQMWLKVIVACLPAVVVGILLDDPHDIVIFHELKQPRGEPSPVLGPLPTPSPSSRQAAFTFMSHLSSPRGSGDHPSRW